MTDLQPQGLITHLPERDWTEPARNGPRRQIPGLWMAATSLALALLRTIFDVIELAGR